jgi:hypothetical protein
MRFFSFILLAWLGRKREIVSRMFSSVLAVVDV